MNIHTTKLALGNDRVPEGHTLIGWINRHPSDPEGRDHAYAVLRTPAGVEVAWEGAPTMRRLPRDWRDRVLFEPAEGPISKPLFDALRAAVEADGAQAVSDKLGVARPNLLRWLREGRMALSYADSVAAMLGLSVTPHSQSQGDDAGT